MRETFLVTGALGCIGAWVALTLVEEDVPVVGYDLGDDRATRSEDALGHPVTLYGVHKQANEETARVYWLEDRLPSIGLRPYVVYGPGRDQGMTAGPTFAMEAAARREGYTIPWSSRCTFTLARDAARAFVDAARASASVEGAPVYNVPGANVATAEVVAAIEAAAPDAAGMIDVGDATLPFPAKFATGGFPMPETPLADGVRETVEFFRARTAPPSEP